jgi:hypothetical protein
MKNISTLFLVLLLSAIPSSGNTTDEVPVVNTTDVATSITVDTVIPTASTEVQPPATTTESPWKSLVWYTVAALISLLASTIILIAKFGIKKLEQKLGISLPDAVDQLTEGYLVKGINWTENWAKDKANKPTSEDKMVETIRYAIEKTTENEILRKKIEEKGKEIVEKLLKSKETPDSATPKV